MKITIKVNFILCSVGLMIFADATFGSLRSDKVFPADARKTRAYVTDGVIVGGDRAMQDVVVLDMRRSMNREFERLVIDVEASRGEENPTAIARPPYYQVAVSPEEKRIVFTMWGNPKLVFDAKKVVASFLKSPNVSDISIFPRVDKSNWTFVINMKKGRPVEVFELTDPPRIIIDINSG